MSRRALLGSGLTDRDVRRLVRAEDIARIRWGAYRAGSELQFPEDRHRQLVAATADRFQPGSAAVVSHASAAVMFGVAARGLDLSRVHVTRPGRPGASSSGAVRPHRGVVDDDEITTVDGIPVTTAARTALDIARSAPFTQAVMVTDAMLRLGLMTPEGFETLIERARRRRAAGGASQVAAFADGRSESPAESHSRVVMAKLGLPEPVLQAVIRTESGRFVARTDFGIEEFRTVAECDGLSKYIRYLKPGETAADAVIREKRREDEIRGTGREMVRWIPAEIGQPVVLLRRFQRAFARAGFPEWRPGPPRVPLTGSARRAAGGIRR